MSERRRKSSGGKAAAKGAKPKRGPASASIDARRAPAKGGKPTGTGWLGASKVGRAREVAASEFIGGSIDSDDYLYRAAGEGPRDLPSYTHDRQIELAFGLFLTDPLAKRIVEITKDYVIADGITYEVEQSEAEREAERAAQAEHAKARAERKATIARAGLGMFPLAPGGTGAGSTKAAPPGTPRASDLSQRTVEALERDPGAPIAPKGLPPVVDDEPTSDELRAVLDRHWNDPDNNWPLKQHDRVTGLGVWGEQLYPAFVNPTTGHVKLGRIDLRRIKEVRTDPENEERVVAVALHPLAGETRGKVYRVVHVHEAVDSAEGAPSESEGYLVGAEDDAREGGSKGGSKGAETYDGTCFYFAVNRIQGAKRGHSDLLTLIDMIDAYGSLLMNGIDSAAQKNSFIWDVLLTGADDAAIADFKRKNAKPPKPGAVRVHNENVTWTAVSPDLGATQHVELARLYRVHILGGAGLPEHWYGEGDSATRATAAEMSAPVLRRLKSRQTYVTSMIQDVLRFQVDQAILAGEIRGTPETKKRVTVHAPEFEAGDVAIGAAALAQSTNALAVAEDRGWVTRDTARKGFAAVASHLGVTINADAEKDAIEAQDGAEADQATADAEDAAANMAAVAGAAGAAGGRGVVPPQGGMGGMSDMMGSGGGRAAEALAAGSRSRFVEIEVSDAS